MAKCARRSSTLEIRFLLLLLSIQWRVNGKVDGRGTNVAGGSGVNDDVAVSMTIYCSSVTIFRLLTADCTALNVSSVRQLQLERYEEVTLLRLADNRLVVLGPDELYRAVPHLQQLYLAGNFITDIQEHAFRNLRTLQILDLADNHLTSIPARSFYHLPALRVISLRGNAIVQVDEYSFASLPLIESIDLTACRLAQVDRRAFAGCRHLVDLSLAGNNLSELSPTTVGYLPAPSILTRLRVDGNPWLCDCRLRWLHERIQSAATVAFRAERQQPVCNEPHLLRSIQWRHLLPHQFACPSRTITDGRRDSTHLTAAAGANVTISCIVVGDPAPTVRWTRDSLTSNTPPIPPVSGHYHSEMTPSGVEQLPPWRIVSSLKLIDVDASDAGEYRCIADNPTGRAEMKYTVVITSVAVSNRSKACDHRSEETDADKRTTRIAVMIGSATVAVISAGVAGCVVAIRLLTVKLQPTGVAKSTTVLRRSLSVTIDRRERCSTSVVSGTAFTGQTVSQPVSVAWADCALSPIDDEDGNSQKQSTTVEQHQFRMRIFPAACNAYD